MAESEQWIDWDAVTDLGKCPDAEIAKRCGVTECRVGQVRRKRGIKAWRDTSTKPRGGRRVPEAYRDGAK